MLLRGLRGFGPSGNVILTLTEVREEGIMGSVMLIVGAAAHDVLLAKEFMAWVSGARVSQE